LKILLLFISIVLSSLIDIKANEENWDRIIIERMLSSVSDKTDISVYTEDTKLKMIIKTSKVFTIKEYCSEADFILISSKSKIVCDKPAIVFNFKKFRSNPNAIGVFYWQKGRPTIRFSSKRLSLYGLHVSGELSKFVSTKY
jgi:hypothetical protein